MIRDALLAFGVAQSSATQWRLAGLPLGVGDLSIVLWITICLFDVLAGRATPQIEALYRLGSFWIIFAFALSIGALVGFIVEYQVWLSQTLHDTLAYLLMATTSCLAVATADAPRRFRRMAWLLMLFSNIGIGIQIAAGWELIHLPSVDPWFWDRFRGWSENPNQLAINCCILGLLAVHLAVSSKGFLRLLGILASIGPLVAGRLSKSDTFISVMIFSGVTLLVLQLYRSLSTGKFRSDLRYSYLLLAALFIVPMTVSLLPFAKAGTSDAESFALSLAKDKGGLASEQTLDLRLHLWNEAAEMGVRSGALGLGPGPHLDPPPNASAENRSKPFEAHNTPLDVFLQAGIIGLAALFAFLASTAALLYRAQLYSLFVLVLAITIFGSAHFIIRHPIVWFALALCVSTGCAQRRSMQRLDPRH